MACWGSLLAAARQTAYTQLQRPISRFPRAFLLLSLSLTMELVPPNKAIARPRPFRTAVLRGLGGFLAPLLTIVILLWIWQTLKYYILQPVETGTRNFIAWQIADVKPEIPAEAMQDPQNPNAFEIEGAAYHRLENGQLIPRDVYDTVVRRSENVPTRGRDFYRRWVELEYLRPWIVVPVFLLVFMALMYLLGSLFAVGLGRVFWSVFEDSLGRLPVIRAVYAPVKQVTDYMFRENEPQFNRVVAAEYPRRGVWTIAFVTGEGLADVQRITNEPMLTVLFPTCPTPIAGNTKLVARRETIDLPMTVDQAFQYILSFGVVVPEDQVQAARLLISEAENQIGDPGAAGASDGSKPTELAT
jgi:uncharacterized membrane protein